MQKDRYRVIQWGAGYLGYYALKYILSNPKLELAGLKCFTPEKEGKTASEICGVEQSGVRATRDGKALLEMPADVVLYMPRDYFEDPSVPGNSSSAWLEDLIAILESGKNVITSICAGTHYRHLKDGEGFKKRLDTACKRGHSTLLFTGFDPGFSDVLAITMSGAVGGIRQIQTSEMVDYGDYPILDTLKAMGFGVRPQDLPQNGDFVRVNWGGVLHLMADAVGVAIEDMKMDADVYLAPKTFTAVGGLLIEEGTVGALRFSISAIVDGRPMFTVNHVTRIGQEMAPEWPSIGRDGGYRVEIDAYPPFVGDFPMGLPGGTGTTLSDAMCMTTARCVNVIEAVVRAAPGYVTFLDLPPACGRYAFARQR